MKKTNNLYAIYKYDFRPAQQRTISAEAEGADGRQNVKAARMYFNTLFDENHIDNLAKTNRRGEATRLPNDVMAKTGDIYLWRVNNSQIKEWWSKNGKDNRGIDLYEKKEVESNPFCSVLIDNRAGRCLMAIEKSAAWGSNPDTLRDMLLDNFNRILGDRYDLEMEIEGLYNPTDIYIFMDDRRDNHHDYIKRVTYEWNTRKASASNVQNNALRTMIKRTQIKGALKGHYAEDYDEKSSPELGDKDKFLVEMVRLWREASGFDVIMQWHEYGRYRIGDYVKAYYPMTKEKLTGFSNNEMTMNEKTDLEEWFDLVMEETKGYTYESKVPKRRQK